MTAMTTWAKITAPWLGWSYCPVRNEPLFNLLLFERKTALATFCSIFTTRHAAKHTSPSYVFNILPQHKDIRTGDFA